MSTTQDRSSRRPDHRTARSVGKVLFAALAAVFLTVVATLLPGIERLVPGTGISAGILIRAVVTLAVAAALGYTASGLATLTHAAVRQRPVAEHAGSVVYWLVVLAAVLLVHWGLAPLARAALGSGIWLYDTAFLLTALGPLAVVAGRLYATVDPVADLFAQRVAGSGER
jgi:hypothetical protein